MQHKCASGKQQPSSLGRASSHGQQHEVPRCPPRWRSAVVMPSRRCHICRACPLSCASTPSAGRQAERAGRQSGQAGGRAEGRASEQDKQAWQARGPERAAAGADIACSNGCCQFPAAGTAQRGARHSTAPHHTASPLTQHQARPHHTLQEPLQLLAVVRPAAARGLHHQVERSLQAAAGEGEKGGGGGKEMPVGECGLVVCPNDFPAGVAACLLNAQQQQQQQPP